MKAVRKTEGWYTNYKLTLKFDTPFFISGKLTP